MERFFEFPIRSGCKAAFLLVPFILGFTFITSCKRQSQKSENPVEVKSQAPLGLQEVVQPAYPKLPPPTNDEIKTALDRVFQGALIADNQEQPGHILGDFNGDGSEDLAIWVKPIPAQLAEINDELANWTLVDPHKTLVPNPKVRVVHLPPTTPKPEKIQPSELVLAIIHGLYDKGWRDPKARQAYVLHRVDGRMLSTRHVDRLPGTMHSADVVFTQRNGFLYWTGGAYAWKESPVASF
jgi:hypothetical protein